jgi:ATP-binding cassette subfamily C protein LapB
MSTGPALVVAGGTAHDAPPTVQALGAADSTDTLAQCTLWMCHHHGIDRTWTSLTSERSCDQPLLPAQAAGVLRAAGLVADIVQRKPEQILDLLLPVILLMKNGEACILMRRVALPNRSSGADTEYELLWPGQPDHRRQVESAALLADYSGFAIFVGPELSADKGQNADDEAPPSRHWLWSTLRQYLPYYRSSMLAAALSNVLMLATGLFSSVVLDKVVPHKSFVTLWTLAIGVSLAIMFDLTARQIRSYLIDLAGKKSDLALASLLFRQALTVRLEHRPASAGSFGHHLAQIELVREFTTSATLTVVSDLPFIFVFILMTYVVAGPLVLVPLLAVPVILGVSWASQRLLRRHMSDTLRMQASMQGDLIEAIEGLEDVRAAGAQGHFIKRHQKANAAAADSALRARILSGWVNNFSMISQQLVTVVLLVWGVYLVADNQVTSGALVGSMMFCLRAIAPLSSVVSLATRFQGARAALAALDKLMSLPTERQSGRRYVPRTRIQGALGMREVSFKYPEGPGGHAPLVLKKVNLQIRAGDRVAILGRIGSGKSTLLRLLAGLYLPTEGLVEADGLDLRQIDPADFRTQIGFVSQDPRLFAGTLKDNILLDRPNARIENFLEVLRLTGLDRFAAAHPLGLDLPVGEMGNLLSGGQRQMVALARCLVIQPQVLLLDEPTSSMDAQAEATFIQHLRTSVGERTLVLVTHRPALLDLVNRVVVVDDGRIVADGPKAQVMDALAGKPAGAAA